MSHLLLIQSFKLRNVLSDNVLFTLSSNFFLSPREHRHLDSDITSLLLNNVPIENILHVSLAEWVDKLYLVPYHH